DAAFIPDVRNNGCTKVLDAVGGFVAWPKNQVVLDPKATPPSTIQMITGENKTAPKVQTKRNNVYVSSDAMQKEAKIRISQKALERIEKTKRSKNDQKPTRNGKKTKSQEQDKEISQKSQPDQPDTVKLSQRKKQRDQKSSQGAIIVKSPKIQGLVLKFKDQGLNLPKSESCFIKKK
ncbi:hypothetical protein Tco_1416344, partial [Tanacetum coccineum]